MLFKLTVSNMRKSMRDYAIYFFTMMIGVAIFYVFNAIGTQAAFMAMSEDTRAIVDLLTTAISGVSIFVAVVLGFLIVYASRFLMKRRHKEFALYLILGMGKGKISLILLLETILIGAGSLVAGLLAGVGLSQLMSAVVASMFEANMSSYKFTVSADAVLKTILYFGLMYIVVMIFNTGVISRYKLIDLIQAGKKSENMKLKNPVVCVIVFFASAAALGYAYYLVCFNQSDLTNAKLQTAIVIGAVSTFFIFWSAAGMLLRLFMSLKPVYFRGLNAFTFRQLSSKVNTMVMSMTVICLMLFVTICTLTASFSVRNSMNDTLTEHCPVDFQYEVSYVDYTSGAESIDALDYAKSRDFDFSDKLSESVSFGLYQDEHFTGADFFEESENGRDNIVQYAYNFPETVVSLSDYNALMTLYGRETISLDDDQYAVVCDFSYMKDLRNDILANGRDITVFGNNLKPVKNECIYGFYQMTAQEINSGFFVVPDYVVKGQSKYGEVISGNFKADSDEKRAELDKQVRAEYDASNEKFGYSYDESLYTDLSTGDATRSNAVGLGAMVTFLGLYIGIVFLISSALVLALKELSDTADSVERYAMLRKIGADEKDISKSIFRQTGIFFFMPLCLAIVHSFFGMKFAQLFLKFFGSSGLTQSIITTAVIFVLIYGGYFVITYLCEKNIIALSGNVRN